MKCALIIPAWTPEDIFSSKTAGSQINYWQPLGTLYVAAVLQQAGQEVRFYNGAFMGHDEIMREVCAYQPEFVGIYSTAFGWEKAKMTAAAIKQSLTEVLMAVGGPYPVALQEKCLEDCPDIDAVVTGEGEVTTVEILARLGSGKDLDGLEGVAY